jgi:hypothetical protein
MLDIEERSAVYNLPFYGLVCEMRKYFAIGLSAQGFIPIQTLRIGGIGGNFPKQHEAQEIAFMQQL